MYDHAHAAHERLEAGALLLRNALDELYNLKSDPGELTNRYKDPQHREVRARLQQRLDERMKAIRDPMIQESR